ncbi:hypothetical protein BH11BAC7_BH11BAC7_17950 [soil metagenome]
MSEVTTPNFELNNYLRHSPGEYFGNQKLTNHLI